MAPATESQSSFLSRISIRRNQIVSMEVNHEQELQELESFQKYVAGRFSELLCPPPLSAGNIDAGANSPPSDPILSISWLRKLLDVFMSCEAEFKTVLITGPGPGPGPGRDPFQISKPPLDRVVPEMLDRVVKALDICTAVVNGVDSVRDCQRLAEIAVTALKQRPLSDGSVRRAKRALTSLLNALNPEEKGSRNGSGSSGRRTTERSWSFSRRNGGGYVSKNWSAAKQIQAMTANLIAPRGTEASSPAALPVHIISTIMVLVMWVLVAAVPCQTSNGLPTHLPLPKHQSWASAAINIHDRIGEEIKRKERRGGGFSGGLMEEMQRMERIGMGLMEFAEGFRSAEEVAEKVAEMEEVCRRMEELDGLQRQVREVFHRMVRSRTEILEALDQAGRNTTPPPL
ncbi:PREDICTED: uncharacterized protein LOC104813026 [Tarenaya hassleriana]|uniref:uncharacterized protein LOC104813026 n=1 Tax=Tarenaya hassleriana TaxID=28532 RepID=UPI00053C5562|nr:PREDICTED: uncharacterized protein LOC104813026 [Tarenaya hassleriana]